MHGYRNGQPLARAVDAAEGTARLADVDTATPAQVWRQHRAACGVSRAEHTAYTDGAAQASALLMD
ncbi:hypothetical protein A4E84_00065 [Streptomyces qaidamensis]|uniref:Uncharacterized protein n=1 Tax=Streptomyces qaidamensis TaxID=1783515 RepID=A0A143BTD2_9ACTN|nr:hypothetical protein A4E84_00065 [Streptomyces qaidamensis]